LVDVLGGAVFSNLNHGAADLQITTRIVGIDDGQRHARIAAHVAILLAPAGRVEDDVLAIEIAPYGSDLRPPIGHEGAQTGESAFLEKIEIFFRNDVGHCGLSPGLIESPTKFLLTRL